MVSIPFNPPQLTTISPRLPMKDLSLFLIKNSFASKMRRGLRNFCNGVGSTTTLNQSKTDADVSCVAVTQSVSDNILDGSPKTLEEMLLQLDLEEAAARRDKLDDYGELNRRMSCVNNSDILRSARNALNQYPRFSLDGRDAMYRSSFRNVGGALGGGGRKSVCSRKSGYELDMERNLRMPAMVAGECVVWCKPGVVAKLMGLDAVPVPVPGRSRGQGRKRSSAGSNRSRSLRRMERGEVERDRVAMNVMSRARLRRESMGSSSGAKHCCVRKPGGEDWQFRQAR